MTRVSRIRDAFMPWAGLVLGLVALGFNHQFGSDGVFDHCASMSPGPLLISVLASLVLAGIGAWASWTVLGERTPSPVRRLAAVISIGAAALFALAIALPAIAALILPPCFG